MSNCADTVSAEADEAGLQLRSAERAVCRMATVVTASVIIS